MGPLKCTYLSTLDDLASRNVSPDELIRKLDESVSELTAFQNLHHIFICQLPPRFDFHNVNSKVIRFNELLPERFADTGEFVTALDPVSAEFRFYHHEGLHLKVNCNVLTSEVYLTDLGM